MKKNISPVTLSSEDEDLVVPKKTINIEKFLLKNIWLLLFGVIGFSITMLLVILLRIIVMEI